MFHIPCILFLESASCPSCWGWCWKPVEQVAFCGHKRKGLLSVWGGLKWFPTQRVWDVVPQPLCSDINCGSKLRPSFHDPLSVVARVCLHHVCEIEKIIALLEYSKMHRSVAGEICCVTFVYPGSWVSRTVNRRWSSPHLCHCSGTSAPVWRCPCPLHCVHQPGTQDTSRTEKVTNDQSAVGTVCPKASKNKNKKSEKRKN